MEKVSRLWVFFQPGNRPPIRSTRPAVSRLVLQTRLGVMRSRNDWLIVWLTSESVEVVWAVSWRPADTGTPAVPGPDRLLHRVISLRRGAKRQPVNSSPGMILVEMTLIDPISRRHAMILRSCMYSRIDV